MPIRAVIFDMDGVLVDSEPIWHQVRVELSAAHGRTWTEELHRACMGTSTQEWAEIMKKGIPLEMSIPEVIEDVRGRMLDSYRRHLPVLPGAVEAVHRMGTAFRLALASGSTTPLIHHVLSATALDRIIPVVVLGDTVPRGKPEPDIYLEAARRLGLPPGECVGIEDSRNGLKSLKAAGMKAVAVPSPDYPLTPEAVALADLVLANLDQLTVDAVRQLDR